MRCDEIASHLEQEDAQIALSVHFHRSITDGVLSAMSEVPMHEIGMPNSIIAFASLRDQIGFLAQAVERLVAGPPQHEVEKAQYADEPAKARELCARIEHVLVGNVRNHIHAIHREFAVLERELVDSH